MAPHLTDVPARRTLDLTGLPEPFVRQVEQLVRQEREKRTQEAGASANGSPEASTARPASGFVQWDGEVIGTLSRREIYDDVG